MPIFLSSKCVYFRRPFTCAHNLFNHGTKLLLYSMKVTTYNGKSEWRHETTKNSWFCLFVWMAIVVGMQANRQSHQMSHQWKRSLLNTSLWLHLLCQIMLASFFFVRSFCWRILFLVCSERFEMSISYDNSLAFTFCKTFIFIEQWLDELIFCMLLLSSKW